MQGSSLRLACVAGGISVGVLRRVGTSHFEIFSRGKPLPRSLRVAAKEVPRAQESRQLHRLLTLHFFKYTTYMYHPPHDWHLRDPGLWFALL